MTQTRRLAARRPGAARPRARDVTGQAPAGEPAAGRGRAPSGHGREGEPRSTDAQREFLSFVSHELKHPLAIITGFVQLMRRRKAYDEAAVDAVLAQARRLERLLNDLVDTAQADSGRLALRPGPTDLGALVAATAAEAQAMTARHAVRAEVPNERVAGDWDAERLGQVLQNLLGNAIKYAPDHSEIVARLEPRDGTGDVRVSVVDQGPGIPPEALPHLFDRFYRAPPAATNGTPGLGLGLYISRMLVEAHGGRIWAEPAGCGTAFRFTLPGPPSAGERP